MKYFYYLIILFFALSCQKFDIKGAWYNVTDDKSVVITKDSMFIFRTSKSSKWDSNEKIRISNDTIYHDDSTILKLYAFCLDNDILSNNITYKQLINSNEIQKRGLYDIIVERGLLKATDFNTFKTIWDESKVPFLKEYVSTFEVITPITNDSIKVTFKIPLTENSELTSKQKALMKMGKPVFKTKERILIRVK